MILDRLREIARKHVERITRNPDSPPCLSDEQVVQVLSSDFRIESLEQWLSPIKEKEDLFVSCPS